MTQKQKVCYLMRLSHNRTIKLYFHITSLEPGELSTFRHGFNFDMQNVYIGELDPRLQVAIIILIKKNIYLKKNLKLVILDCKQYARNIKLYFRHNLVRRLKQTDGLRDINLPKSTKLRERETTTRHQVSFQTYFNWCYKRNIFIYLSNIFN